MSQPLLQIHQLCCERDERLLFCNLNLQVESGDIVQIEGPNGSGKTTLLRLLTTSSEDYDGELKWQGQLLKQARLEYLNQLIYIGHLPGVKKSLTPKENLNWYAGLYQGLQRCTIETALEQVGLFGFEDVSCFNLSAGQLRRVALARLYLTPAKIWILDEPFTAIDKQGVQNLERLMSEHASGGGCVILTTHQDLNINPLRKINLSDYRAATSSLDDFGTGR